jgi:hypothetical protein
LSPSSISQEFSSPSGSPSCSTRSYMLMPGHTWFYWIKANQTDQIWLQQLHT